MSLSIQERLKDLRVERGLTLGQLAEQTGLSKSALGSYETYSAASPFDSVYSIAQSRTVQAMDGTSGD